jgi:hypothetical protein
MPIQNTIECTKNGYKKILGACIYFKNDNVGFAGIDNSYSSLTSNNRAIGAGFSVSKTSQANSSNSVRSNPFPLLFTTQAGTQSINFTPLAIDLSQDFFIYEENGFLVIPLLFNSDTNNSALTLLQRTVQLAVRTNDVVPKIYGAVATAGLTPTVVDPRFTVVLGDTTNAGTMDLRNTQQKIKIPLDAINNGLGVANNISATKTIDNIGIGFNLNIGSQFEYYKPEIYASPDFYCPDFVKICLKDLTKFDFKLQDSFKDVNNVKDDSADVSLEGLDIKLIAKALGAIRRSGGRGKPIIKQGTIPASLSVTGTDIDLINSTSDVSVVVTDSTGCMSTFSVIEGANPLKSQVTLVKGANNKLVFNNVDANKGYKLKITGNDSQRVTYTINKSRSIVATLEVELGNSDTIESSTDINIVRFNNFLVSTSANIYTLDEAKLPETTLKLEYTADSFTEIDGEKC